MSSVLNSIKVQVRVGILVVVSTDGASKRNVHLKFNNQAILRTLLKFEDQVIL